MEVYYVFGYASDVVLSYRGIDLGGRILGYIFRIWEVEGDITS